MDCPSSSIPPPSPQQIETMVTYMNLHFFRAAENGNMEPFDAYQDPLDQLVDANQNTALHIYSMTGGDQDSSVISTNNFLQQLVDKCPRLLLQGNARGEIPLHVAARHGHYAIVEFFINRSKEQHVDLEQMLRMRDKEQNTALHKAVQYCHPDVVRQLLKEDPDISSAVNTSSETPLYIAARENRWRYNKLVAMILDSNCRPMALVGPRGRTILHAAALANNEDTVRTILERKKHLAKERDEDGWTPLHYTAHFGLHSVAELLLKCDGSTAYISDEERGISPLHMAAWQGNTRMMELIIFLCPGCLGILDKKGWNFLHFALVTLPPKLFYDRFFYYKRTFTRVSAGTMNLFDDDHQRLFIKESETISLLDEKDENGITPFHILLYGPARHCDGYDSVVSALKSRLGPQIPDWDEYSQDSQKKKKIEEVLKEISNIEVAGKPVHDPFFRQNHNSSRENMEAGKDSNTVHESPRENMEEKDSDMVIMEKVRETHLLVATLVATVTFAAAFTVPGGYKSEEGTAVLSRNSAFKAFVITDCLSFVFSLSAVLIHFDVVLSNSNHQYELIRVADEFTSAGMMMMVIAFSTGLYSVLESSPSLAKAACSIPITLFLASAYYFLGRFACW